MDVSRSTLNNDVRKLRKMLEEYDLSLKGRAGQGLTMSGNEYDIRRFLIEQLYPFIYKDEMIPKGIREVAHRELDRYAINPETQELFFSYLNVALDRRSAGFYLLDEDDLFRGLEKNGVMNIADAVASACEHYYSFPENQQERYFLAAPLAGMRTPTEVEGLESLVEIDEDVLHLMDKIAKKIQSETDLVFQFTDILDEFVYHLTFMRNRLLYKVRVESPVKDVMKLKYPLAYCVSEIAAETIEEETGLHVSEDEKSFLCSYFEVILREQESKKPESFRVQVVSSGGGASKRLILHQLEKVLKPTDEIEFSSSVEKAVRQPCDLIIVTTSEKIPSQLSVPIIQLNMVFDEEMVRERIQKIRYLKRLKISMKSASASVLFSLLEKEHLFIFDETTPSPEAALEKMCRALRSDGKVDAAFEARVKEREREASTRFTSSVAFPHTFQTLGEEAVIALGLFPTGTEADKEIRIMILAALPERTEDDLTLVRLYEEILRLSENTDAIEDLSKSQSYEELRRCLIVRHPVLAPGNQKD